MEPKSIPYIAVVAALAISLTSASLTGNQQIASPSHAQQQLPEQNNSGSASGKGSLISEHIPLRGELAENDYLVLADFTPFKVNSNETSATERPEGLTLEDLGIGDDDEENETNGNTSESEEQLPIFDGIGHMVLRVPCDDDGNPHVAVLVSTTPDIIELGVKPKFAVLDLGDTVEFGTLGDVNVRLSDFGKSCLYHADLPGGISNIALLNVSDDTLSFEEGTFFATVTAEVLLGDEENLTINNQTNNENDADSG